MVTTREKLEFANWLVVFPQPDRKDYFIVMEKHPDGTVTFWRYTMFGAVGDRGTLRADVKTKPVTNAKERAEVERVKRLIGRAVERSKQAYEVEKARS